LSTKSISGTAKKTKRTGNPSKPDGISEQGIVHQSEARLSKYNSFEYILTPLSMDPNNFINKLEFIENKC
jgi:hypothetical protein